MFDVQENEFHEKNVLLHTFTYFMKQATSNFDEISDPYGKRIVERNKLEKYFVKTEKSMLISRNF